MLAFCGAGDDPPQLQPVGSSPVPLLPCLAPAPRPPSSRGHKPLLKTKNVFYSIVAYLPQAEQALPHFLAEVSHIRFNQP